MARTLIVVLSLAAAFAAVSGSPERAASQRPKPAGCPVTLPNHTVPAGAGFSAAGFNYGHTLLRAHLHWPRGRLPAGILTSGGSYAIVDENGSISVKLGWWRRRSGKLMIAGRRLDASAPPLQAHVPDGYGPSGFQPSGLTFPTVGCWKVAGTVGTTRLRFVVKVVKLKLF